MALEIGRPFPSFALPNQDGQVRTLADYTGKWLVLYVYPKDDTPGCTIQGKAFTATKSEFESAGVQVVGLSGDDVDSHKAFCNKYSLTIDLLADPAHALLTAAGVGQKEHKGSLSWKRTTFVIDPRGNLRKLYEDVIPQDHEKTLLADIKALKG